MKFFAIWNRTVLLAVTVNSKCITFGWVFFKAFLAEIKYSAYTMHICVKIGA